MSVKETIAKAAGKVKRAGASLTGDVAIFRQLKEEHGEVSALMMQVRAGGEDARRDLYPVIRRELLAHARAEEHEVYPVFEQFAELRDDTLRLRSEHDQIKRYFDQLDVTPITSEAWERTFKDLMRTVQDHVRQEEKHVFARAEELISDERAEQMVQRFTEVREREMKILEQRPFASASDRDAPTTHV